MVRPAFSPLILAERRVRSDDCSALHLACTSLDAMPPRIRLLSQTASLPFRPRAPAARWHEAMIPQRRRAFASGSKDLPVSQDKKDPNADTMPHVSEEAAALGKITGTPGPDLEQGTPVEEVR